jgi:ankyrin repeat protein
MLEVLLDHEGVDPNLPNREGNSPLHLASDYEIIRVLLAKGADPSKKNAEGNTILHLFFRCPKWPVRTLVRCVDLLLEKNVDANAVNARGDTPLHELLRRGPQCVERCLVIVRKMVARGALDLSLVNEKGRTFYEIATNRFRTGFDSWRLMMLLEGWMEQHQKENLRRQQRSIAWQAMTNADGRSPLHFLASSLHAPTLEEHLAEMRRVLDFGVAPNTRDKDGRTALLVAVNTRNVDDIFGVDHLPYFPDLPILGGVVTPEDILERKEEFAKKFIEEVAKLLLEAGADPNLDDEYTFLSPLHAAAAAPFSTACIEHLLNAGADCRLKDSMHRNPLLLLLQNHAPPPALIRRMLEKGADVGIEDLDGNTPLTALVAKYQRGLGEGKEWPERLRILLEYGADPEVLMPRTKVSVFRAVMVPLSSKGRWREVWEMMQVLHECGVDLSATTSYSAYGTSPAVVSSYSYSAYSSPTPSSVQPHEPTYAEILCRAFGQYRPTYSEEERDIYFDRIMYSVGEEFFGMLEILVQVGLSAKDVSNCSTAFFGCPHKNRFPSGDYEDMTAWAKKARELLEGAVVWSIKGARFK